MSLAEIVDQMDCRQGKGLTYFETCIINGIGPLIARKDILESSVKGMVYHIVERYR